MAASFYFLSDLPLYETEKPYEIFMSTIPGGLPKTNCEYTKHSNINIKDARDQIHDITLEEFGFCFLPADNFPAPTMECFENGENHEVHRYLKDTVSFVQRNIQADRIICFDWRIRRNVPMPERTSTIANDRLSPLEPATRVHTDYSYNGGKARLHRQLTEEELGEYPLETWRVQFVNVWRPLVPVVEDCPLAFCDRRTVLKQDLLEVDKVHKDHWEGGYFVRHNLNHDWYWLSKQTSNEISMFITWDSDHDTFESSSVSPHAAFHIPKSRVESQPRESVEIRLMVFKKRIVGSMKGFQSRSSCS